jgi:hypothetical protein
MNTSSGSRLLSSVAALLFVLATAGGAAAAEFTIRLKPSENPQQVRAAQFLGSASGGTICVKVDGTKIQLTTNKGDTVGVVTKKLMDQIQATQKGAIAANQTIVAHITSPAFKVTATTVTACDDADTTETNLKLFIDQGPPQPNDWRSTVLYEGKASVNPLVRKQPPPLPVSFTEVESIVQADEMGKKVNKLQVTLTLKNSAAADTCVRPWLMVNWFKKDGTEARTISLFDNLTAAQIAQIAAGTASITDLGNTSAFGEKNITVPAGKTVTATFTWPPKGDVEDAPAQGQNGPGEFDLGRKFLAYVDWFKCGAGNARGDVIQYSAWVKDPPQQSAATTADYNIFPTNPPFYSQPADVFLVVDRADLPADVTVETFPAEGDVFEIDTDTMQQGTLRVSIGSGPHDSIVVPVGVYDADTETLLLTDFTEIRPSFLDPTCPGAGATEAASNPGSPDHEIATCASGVGFTLGDAAAACGGEVQYFSYVCSDFPASFPYQPDDERAWTAYFGCCATLGGGSTGTGGSGTGGSGTGGSGCTIAANETANNPEFPVHEIATCAEGAGFTLADAIAACGGDVGYFDYTCADFPASPPDQPDDERTWTAYFGCCAATPSSGTGGTGGVPAEGGASSSGSGGTGGAPSTGSSP